MKYCLLTDSFDPAFNLAAEEYLFEKADSLNEYMMIWRNMPTVVVGKYQNTIEEIDQKYIEDNNIKVVRRLSGGGAVFHDLGNINYTIIRDWDKNEHIDFTPFMEMVAGMLNSAGINAHITGRNDLTVENRKISGNSQYIKNGRVMHHGTLLFNSDIEAAARALSPPDYKIQSKGIASIESRIANIKSFLGKDITVDEFQQNMTEYFAQIHDYNVRHFSQKEETGICAIKKSRYDKWEWNYGYSPAYKKYRSHYIPGCGNFIVKMNVEGGIIRDFFLEGDFFGSRDMKGLYHMIEGCRPEKDEILNIISQTELNRYIYNISKEDFIEMIIY